MYDYTALFDLFIRYNEVMYRYAQSLVAFVAVGQTGAFVKAARQLGVTPSVISHHISRLEDALGETLIHRTTRKLSLSENGKRLFETTQRGFEGIELETDRIKAGSEHIAGALKIALPAFVPDPNLEARVMEFMLRHPSVALTLEYSDHIVSIVDAAYDLSIRIGDLPDSSLTRKKIGSVQHLFVATPDFLIRHGTPKQPKDLESMPFVSMGRSNDVFSLVRGQNTQEIKLDVCQLSVQSILAAKAGTLAGVGFGSLPEPLITDDLAEGSLLRLLPEWALPPLSIQAVWMGTSRRNSLAKRLVEFLQQ
ncbi:LysR family transcriptional regulator [Shimia sp. R10_1]|uniref:LysR family transcriptional regulator n=1 Tax=Shimia sp. R10_1 TaxID=2821095 RepID=UPI001ADB6CD7|nr:LysR family transcriptional regulator [Shimia sp. R10_1]MBO9475267.1 LysR family transcriptional regulator [Shimia sp. R10_1]